MKKGLVLEGGAMRGMYTAGVLDVLLENNISLQTGSRYALLRLLIQRKILTKSFCHSVAKL